MGKPELIKEYLHKLQTFQTDEKLFQHILHPDFQQTEWPNQLNKNGQQSDLKSLFQRMHMGKTILSSQNFEVTSTIEQSERVAIEALWSGTMAIDAGPLKKGQTLKAHFCMVFDFWEGKIIRQRNYDCFDAF